MDFERDPFFDNIQSTKRELKVPTIKVDTSYNPFENGNTKKQVKKENWEALFENIPSPHTLPKQLLIEQEWEESNLQKASFQLHQQYILSPIKSGLMIIHQQRAHERILYEQFLSLGDNQANCQQLLFPQTVELSTSDMALLEGMKEEVQQLGFTWEIMGRNKIAIQGIPADGTQENAQQLFEELLEQYKNYAKVESSNSDKLARSLAKSMSVKKGQNLSVTEMNRLIDELFACELPNVTASGQATLITLTLKELADKF